MAPPDAPPPDTSAAEAALRAKLSRKRTKTGCLTCRRRRIKCGEEKPTCANCVKSKRNCEGYSQRVVFKQPTHDFRILENAPLDFHAGPGHVVAAPWPTEFGQTFTTPVYPPQDVPYFQQQYHPPMQYHSGGPPARSLIAPSSASQPGQYSATILPHHGPPMHSPASYDTPYQFTFSHNTAYPAPPTHTLPNHDFSQPNWQTPQHEHAPTSHTSQNGVSPASSSQTVPGTFPAAYEESPPTWNGYVQQSELPQHLRNQSSRTPSYQYPVFHATADAPLSSNGSHYIEHGYFGPDVSPTSFLKNAAVESHDNDYYDVGSDDEAEAPLLSTEGASHQQLFQKILTSNNIDVRDPRTRRYDTFIYDGILDRYRPEEVANPLANEATARLFLHFIAVTGPNLSIYERQVRNTSVLFTEGRVPFSQQGLWTYTMPQAALRNRGLLHAMLALASLHVARLTGASATPSMQHYAWALKRIHKSVGDHRKRYNLTTIAATMLLGYYEVVTADHVKWNTHLAGSKQLFLETDFATMAKQLRRMKKERAARGGKRKLSEQTHDRDVILDQIHDIDEHMISEISGKEVRFDVHGQILTSNNSIPQELDLSNFEILRDLYWWYLKQDAYQSIVSGNPLMLNYHRWTDCPPRAPLGRSDAVYGSFDHLILLLGRIADFSAKDRSRKLKVMEANGGQWMPSGMTYPHPLQNGRPPSRTTSTGAPPANVHSMPAGSQFYGMAPPPRQNVQMPSSYYNANTVPFPEAASPSEPVDLHMATQAALAEHDRICTALATFEKSLGEPFKPLTDDYQPPLATPFGPALFYRSYDIGVLWAVYFMAKIIAIRSHPHMHPAAHTAAAIAADSTSFFANEIGRITAGIAPGPPDQPLNPTLGSSLCDSCMPSFFAAIQYIDADQRYYTIRRIQSIARRTGWGSADLIANGCETSWVKTAVAGRGPPYTRVARKMGSGDARLNGSWEALDPNARPDGEDAVDRRLVGMGASNARLHWAIGIIGAEEDVV